MPAASILIKPASANCNMDCKYCFYKVLSSNREEYSKGLMSYETLEKLVCEAIHYAQGHLTFAFQGGELFLQLLQSDKVQQFIEESKELPEQCSRCRYLSLCRGGCRRWREKGGAGGLGINQLCEACEIFFPHTWERIEQLGQMIWDTYGPYRGK